MGEFQIENLKALIVLVIVVGVFLLVALLKERKKNAQPIYEMQATIRSIRLSSQSARGGSFGRYNTRACYATFELEDGSIVELSAYEELCGNPVGTSGTLIFQGTKCEKFTPNGGNDA